MDLERNKLVLILDDDNYFRGLIARLLQTLGLEVMEARSGREASMLLAKYSPILAIVDYNLPEMDGITWISKVRGQGCNWPIVFCSGIWCDEKTFNRLRNILNVSLILSKPIDAHIFLQQIESLLPGWLFEREVESSAWSDLALFAVDEPIEPDAREISRDEEVRIKLAEATAIYVDSLETTWKELSEAINEIQLHPDNQVMISESVQTAHRISGTAGSYGLTRIGGEAGKLERLLHNLDPTDTLLEVMWTEIFRALADGALAVREALAEKGNSAPSDELDALNCRHILLLGQDDTFNLLHRLDTIAPFTVALTDDLANAREKIRKTLFDAAIVDFSAAGHLTMLALAKELRSVPGQELLPLGLIDSVPPGLTAAERVYAGFSASIEGNPISENLEEMLNKLLALREQQTPRVLIVDDDEVLTHFVGTILSGEGMTVRMLNKPILVMDVVDEFKPDVVLLDVMMPGLSGYDICRMLRSHETWHKVAILFLTSKSSQEGRAAAFQAGGDDFLNKPVLAQELIARVRSQLEQAQRKSGVGERDQVTGSLSGQAFIAQASSLLTKQAEEQTPLTLCLLSIDDYSEMNIAHSMFAAKEVVTALGKLMMCRFRPEDLHGRIGEDGFAIAFPGQTSGTVSQAIEMLLHEFADLNFASDYSASFSATFSAGIAESPTDSDSLHGLLNKANQRLLTGRQNRTGVVIRA